MIELRGNVGDYEKISRLGVETYVGAQLARDWRSAASCLLACLCLTTSNDADAAGKAATKNRYREVPLADLADRPPGLFVRQCSLVFDLCVQTSEPHRALAPEILRAAETTLSGLAALSLPLPLRDGARGGGGELDLYLIDGDRATAHGDVGSAVTGYDRASAFVTLPTRAPVGCSDDQAIATAISRAVILGQDAAADPGSLDMLAGRLGQLVAPCSFRESELIDRAQRSPEQTFLGLLGEPGEAAFLFPWFLEDRLGTDEPGKLTVALAAISNQRTLTGPLSDEPDSFDALRVTLQNNKASISASVLDFAIDRAFLGSRSDDQHLTDVAYLGDFGRPRFEWSVTHASLPRSLAPTRPVHPLGSTYFYVDTRAAPENAELTFVAEWEEPVAFRWAIIKLDAEGGELARSVAVPVLGDTRIQRDIRDLKGASGVLVVGVNEGEASRSEPFDPGQERETAKGFVVSFYP